MRLLDDALNSTYDTNREDIITVFLALQKQNFIMANSIRNLIEKWPKALPLLIQK
tara:strand:+ start:525 stop:689 length:165 start_codon:yes stop_codon:yes gene_type:complete